jgi:putative NADH-flavin reductase
MKLAILGATGKVGGHALQSALAAGHHVRALVRTPSKLATRHERLEVVQGDATALEDCARVVEGCDAVVAALGPPGLGATTLRQDAARAITAGMKQRGVKKLVWLSALGVGDNIVQARKTSFLVALFARTLLRKTYVDANAAEQVLFASGLDYVVCRPPELTNKAARGHVEVIPEDRKLPRISIPRADVGAWMVKAASESTFDRRAVTIC